jgi:hypothetical protein
MRLSGSFELIDIISVLSLINYQVLALPRTRFQLSCFSNEYFRWPISTNHSGREEIHYNTISHLFPHLAVPSKQFIP